MGCERLAPFDAMTDHLLALRALLEPEGPASGRLAQRLAAICAVPEERGLLAERIAHAVSLERAVVAGLAPAGPNADALADELSGHLRALLRDVLCGHLDHDLCVLADELLAPQPDARARARAARSSPLSVRPRRRRASPCAAPRSPTGSEDRLQPFDVVDVVVEVGDEDHALLAAEL